jgi:hypothetical protein
MYSYQSVAFVLLVLASVLFITGLFILPVMLLVASLCVLADGNGFNIKERLFSMQDWLTGKR